jgi:CRISPR-associated protein Csb2
MPLGVLSKGREQTTLVFDTWANVGDGAMLIHWPCQLTPDETTLLSGLAANLGYLGRSESWVEAELIEDASPEFNAEPCREGEHRGREWEQVSLVASVPPSNYESWRQKQVDDVLKPFAGQRKTAALKKKQDKAVEPYPSDLTACLTKDTAWWKGHGWSQPPGSQRVLYWRRADALIVSPPQSPRRSQPKPVTAMLLALTTPSGNRSPLPPCSRTLAQGELFHRAIVGRVANGGRVHCPELTGRDDRGKPLHDYHRHSHILPVDLDDDGRIDHILIYAPMGLGAAAQHAIRTMNRTWTKGGVGDLQVALAGSGELSNFRCLPIPFRERVTALIGPSDGARVWTSKTPFVLPRFLKKRGRNSLIGQVHAELESRNLPQATKVELLRDESIAFRHFVRTRKHGGTAPPVDIGFALRIELEKPIEGPLTLGYGAHFGLGLFAAVGD